MSCIESVYLLQIVSISGGMEGHMVAIFEKNNNQFTPLKTKLFDGNAWSWKLKTESPCQAKWVSKTTGDPGYINEDISTVCAEIRRGSIKEMSLDFHAIVSSINL